MNSTKDQIKHSTATDDKPPVIRSWRGERYNVLTGLVHSYCQPYRTNTYWKAVVALIWRKIKFGRGYIINSW